MLAMSTAQLPAVVLCVLAVVVVIRRHKTRLRRLRLPPGPSPLPIVGNIFDIPREFSAKAYQPLVDMYGDVVYLDTVTQSIVILSAYAVASELLDKRSAKYSERPSSVMLSLIGAEWLTSSIGYNDMWRRLRKRYHDFFSPTAIRSYAYAQEAGARRLIQLLLSNPAEFAKNVEFVFGSTVLSSVYGLDIASPENEYLLLADNVMRFIQKILTPGVYLVETFPWIQYIPAWVPGMGFKRNAVVWGRTLESFRDKPFQTAFDSVSRGDSAPCVVETVLNKISTQTQLEQEYEMNLTKNVCGNVYLAAIETVTASFLTFLCAMALNSEVQARAQAEIDAVVGSDRLPLLNDRPMLPYIDAILSECLRWMPTARFGLPHASREDDEYNGYLIPKGSVIFVNVWAIARSKEHYVDPNRFDPERFLAEDGQLKQDILHPRSYVFGFGRRKCPGMHFGETSLFIAIASVLHSMTIKPALDELGKPSVGPTGENVKMKKGFLTHPEVPGYIFEARNHGP